MFSYRDSFLHNVHMYINERDSEATSLTNFSLSSPLSLAINFTLSSSNILFLARFSNTEKEKVWLELEGRIYFSVLLETADPLENYLDKICVYILVFIEKLLKAKYHYLNLQWSFALLLARTGFDLWEVYPNFLE